MAKWRECGQPPMNKNNNVVNATSLWWKSLGKCLGNKLSYIASSYRHSLISHRVAKSTICWHANTFPNTFTLFALKVTLRYCFTILDCNTLPIANTHTYTQRHTHTHTHSGVHPSHTKLVAKILLVVSDQRRVNLLNYGVSSLNMR